MPEARVYKKGEIDLPKLLERFRQKLDNKNGAIGCFIGVVRGETEGGEEVKLLHLESSDEAWRQMSLTIKLFRLSQLPGSPALASARRP